MTTLPSLLAPEKLALDSPAADPEPNPPAWSRAWLDAAHARCRLQAHCANEFGVAWRFQVPESKRSCKPEGECHCQCHAQAPLNVPFQRRR